MAKRRAGSMDETTPIKKNRIQFPGPESQQIDLVIDPGDKNLAIAIPVIKEIYYFKNSYLEANLNIFKTDILSKFSKFNQRIDIVIEKQVYKKNSYIEGFIVGFLLNELSWSKLKVKRLSAKAKTKICQFIFKTNYRKFNRKYLKKQSELFKNSLSIYKTFKYENNLKNEIDKMNEKKIDDIIDVFIMSFHDQIRN
jgi:hypothetical protein